MKVHIEYCVKWNYEPEFERVSNLIYSIHSNAKVSSNENGHRTGSFEVTINGILVFSKFETNRFPTENETNSWL